MTTTQVPKSDEPMQIRAGYPYVRICIAALLILGGVIVVGFQLMFAWGFTDSATWGTWGKSQTSQQHVEASVRHLYLFGWEAILASVASITAGLLLWRKVPKQI